MNLYGWDLLYATKLNVVNEKFIANAKSLASTFTFNSSDPFFDSTVTISGKFGTWSVANNKSNKLIHLTLPVNFLSIGGMSSSNITAIHVEVVVELNLAFISSTTGNNIKTLNFDYSGDGSNGTSKNISVVSVTDPSGRLDATQKGFVGQAIIDCLKNNPQKLNYVFASVILKDEQKDWLSPDNIAFDLVTLENGNCYFCVFGSIGPKAGQEGQVDPSLFNSNDDMYLGLSAALFLERIMLPGFKNAIKNATFAFASPKILIINHPLPGSKVGLITYYPIILSMTIEISGDKLLTSLIGICDLYEGISMSFAQTSKSAIKVNTQSRTIDITPDPAPVFTHNQDLGLWKYLAFIPIGAIVDLISLEVTNVIGNCLAGAISKESGNSSGVTFSTQSLQWTNIDFASLSYGGLADNFFITGKAG